MTIIKLENINSSNISEYRRDFLITELDASFGIWDIFDRAIFESTNDTKLVALSELVSNKNQLKDPKYMSGQKKDPRLTAYERMCDATMGRISKRSPITVQSNADGCYYIIDGNATSQVLMLLNWKVVPVQLV